MVLKRFIITSSVQLEGVGKRRVLPHYDATGFANKKNWVTAADPEACAYFESPATMDGETLI